MESEKGIETQTEVVSETNDKKELKAKTVSLIGKIVGGLVILGGHILKWFGKLPDATSGEICACGFAVMGVFGTIDINLIIDKFTKKGGINE